MLAEAAKGWFMTNRRDKKEGDPVPPYDAHGLDLVRAYQIVCFMVGSNEDKFKHFADEVDLPKDRQDSCALGYSKARSPGAWLSSRICARQISRKRRSTRSMAPPRATSRVSPTRLAPSSCWNSWPSIWQQAPFTVEMQSCGYINAAWVPLTRRLRSVTN